MRLPQRGQTLCDAAQHVQQHTCMHAPLNGASATPLHLMHRNAAGVCTGAHAGVAFTAARVGSIERYEQVAHKRASAPELCSEPGRACSAPRANAPLLTTASGIMRHDQPVPANISYCGSNKLHAPRLKRASLALTAVPACSSRSRRSPGSSDNADKGCSAELLWACSDWNESRQAWYCACNNATK